MNTVRRFLADEFRATACCLLDIRPQEGWIKLGFDGKSECCNLAG